MEQYAIKGGNPLVGEVEIGGAKNAALPILAASVMTDETVYIENMPDVRDTNVLLCAMENIGVIVKRMLYLFQLCFSHFGRAFFLFQPFYVLFVVIYGIVKPIDIII